MSRLDKTSIFISYARTDGADVAQRLQRDLATKGFDAWLDTQRLAGGATWTAEIEQAIDNSEVLLALMSPGSYVSEICRAEQLRSLRKGKRVIPLLARSGSDIPLHLETKNYRDFTGAKPYAAQLKLLLEDVRLGRNAVALRPEFRTTYFNDATAPPLPRKYVERPDALAGLRNAVVTDGSGPSIALTALGGMGGIGKTILSRALCDDEVTQQAFPDGIIWTTAGKEPTYDLITRMQEVRRALGDEPADKESELQCINRYRTLMRTKAALIVVDDVWRSGDVAPFRAESPRSRLLFTTRDTSIAAAFGADEHIADLLTPEQSCELLARWSGSKPDASPPEADAVMRECGRLPLALAMIGAMLRGKPRAYWRHVANLLRNADLAKIKAQFPDYPHTDLLRAIQVSVDALDPKARDRYLALAVLLEDMPIHPVIQQTLWGVDDLEALETAEQFVSLSLAQRGGVQRDGAQRDGETGSIRLHDLQLDYVRAQYPDRAALDLIRGAVRLSSHIIERDPRQFTSQMVGRLLPHQQLPGVRQFSASAIEGAPQPWLRPLWPALHAPGTALVRTLTGHSDRITAVALSADRRRAVSASFDRTLKVWDLETGREERTLAGHSDRVYAVALSADGRQAVSASDDRTLKVWNPETGQVVRTLGGTFLALSADGRRAVSASSSFHRTLKVWDLETGREERTLDGHADVVRAVGMRADGRRAVSASEDTLKVWELETGRELRTLSGHSGGVNCVAVSDDGRRAVSASHDQTLKVWDLETGRQERTLKGHSDAIEGVAVSADGRRAVSASDDRTLKVWDLETGREERTLAGHSDRVYAVALSADGRQAVSASDDGTLKVWDLEAGSEEPTLATRHLLAVTNLAVSADGRRAVFASNDETLKVWDLETGREERTLAGHSSRERHSKGDLSGHGRLAVSADGRLAVSTFWGRPLKVWDLETGRELRTLSGHSGGATCVAVSADGRHAVSGSLHGTLKVWDLETGREALTTSADPPVNRVVITVDGRRAVAASGRGTLTVWDLKTGEVRTLGGRSFPLYGVAVSADGWWAVSASYDRTLKVWDLETGREVRTLEGHSGWVNGVAVSADGQRAVSASEDKSLKVWDLDTGAGVATFTCDAAARCCAFAGNKKIVAGDASHRVHFLELVE